jgi:hypothetical protein
MSAVARQSPPVEQKKSWRKIIIASVAGGAIAVIAGPSITALLAPYALYGFIASTTATGVLGSVTSKVISNTIDADAVTLTIHQHPVQRFYRQTVNGYIGSVLESVLHCIQINSEITLTNRVYFDLSDAFDFRGASAKQNRKMFFEFRYKVIPAAGSRARPLARGVQPRALPTHDADATREVVVGAGKSVLDGTGRAVLEGCAFGIVGGGLGKFAPGVMKQIHVPTVPGKVSIIVGMSSATGVMGPAKDLLFAGATADKASLWLEFVTEVQDQVNRLIRCAKDNEVGLEISMAIASSEKVNGSFPEMGATGSQHHDLFWYTEVTC